MAKRIIAAAKGILASDEGRNDVSGNPVLKIFLEGVYDDGCELSRVRGMWHILKKIWQYVTTFWKEGILVTTKRRDVVLVDDSLSFVDLTFPLNYRIHPFISIKCEIRFPKPSGLYINMMPFIMAKDFEGCKLPDNLLGYWSQIIRRCPISRDEKGKIGYLTIHESHVEENNSQRRPGLHTERPGRLHIRNEESNTAEDDLFETGDGLSIVRENQIYHHWGMGLSVQGRNCFEIEGGIFMASNVDNSCRVWDCQITNDAVIGHLGDIEHLREYLPSSEVMKANHLYWMTDRTPHESLCLQKKTFRQYFRLVTSQVSLWFEEHSTKNPLGVVPDPEITKIVGGSKFVENGLYFV